MHAGPESTQELYLDTFSEGEYHGCMREKFTEEASKPHTRQKPITHRRPEVETRGSLTTQDRCLLQWGKPDCSKGWVSVRLFWKGVGKIRKTLGEER